MGARSPTGHLANGSGQGGLNTRHGGQGGGAISLFPCTHFFLFFCFRFSFSDFFFSSPFYCFLNGFFLYELFHENFLHIHIDFIYVVFLGVDFMCTEFLYVDFMYVKFLYVDFMYVKFLYVDFTYINFMIFIYL